MRSNIIFFSILLISGCSTSKLTTHEEQASRLSNLELCKRIKYGGGNSFQQDEVYTRKLDCSDYPKITKLDNREKSYDIYYGKSAMERTSIEMVISFSESLPPVISAKGREGALNQAKLNVESLLKDPYSAKFSELRIEKFGKGKVVCGKVNAKNSYGGYTGSTDFVAGGNVAALYIDSKYPDIERQSNLGMIMACKL
ncbi:MAG: hypothetical protein CMM93_07940 [Rickettsiales bacterium]|nr:hypothetical protein [Rickettsiales bacterium]|tara:strand:- start:629 stop:1222 length:594 start_codon:yes stop_codon:yes gene_type:complete